MNEESYKTRYGANFPTPARPAIYDVEIPINATNAVRARREAAHSEIKGIKNIRCHQARFHQVHSSRRQRYVGAQITRPRSFLHGRQAASPPGPPPDIVCRPPCHGRAKSTEWDADVPWGNGGHTYIHKYVRGRLESVEQSGQSDHEYHTPPLCVNRNAPHRPIPVGQQDLGGPPQRQTDVGEAEDNLSKGRHGR